jgi:hypothetical protein
MIGYLTASSDSGWGQEACHPIQWRTASNSSSTSCHFSICTWYSNFFWWMPMLRLFASSLCIWSCFVSLWLFLSRISVGPVFSIFHVIRVCLFSTLSTNDHSFTSLMHVRLRVLLVETQLVPLPKGTTWSVLVETTGSLCDGQWVNCLLAACWSHNAITNLTVWILKSPS